MENQVLTRRTPEKVKQCLAHAKIDENDLIPTSQSLYFTEDDLYDSSYKFLELDKYLAEALKTGEVLQIIGDNSENAVLCSKDRTYELIEAETSNSLLLVKKFKFSSEVANAKENSCEVTIQKVFYTYLEAIHSRPRFKKLTEILNKTSYKGPEREYQINDDDLFTKQQLLNIVQASEKELDEGLRLLDAIVINEKIRKLDFEYKFRILSYMVKLIDENSWALDEIDYDETINSLQDFISREILDQVFNLYTKETKIIDGVQLYRYKDSVATFFAEVLLSNGGKFKLDEFMEAWRESVPDGMNISESMLYEIAVIDRKANPNTVRALSEASLPDDIGKRFEVLFNVKDKWTVEEIAPYIRKLTTEKIDINALLAKFTRVFKMNDVKYYCSKH